MRFDLLGPQLRGVYQSEENFGKPVTHSPPINKNTVGNELSGFSRKGQRANHLRNDFCDKAVLLKDLFEHAHKTEIYKIYKKISQ